MILSLMKHVNRGGYQGKEETGGYIYNKRSKINTRRKQKRNYSKEGKKEQNKMKNETLNKSRKKK